MVTEVNPAGFSLRSADQPNGVYPRILPYDGWSTYSEHFHIGASGLPYGWTNTNTNGTPTIGAHALLQTLGGADNDVSHAYASTATIQPAAGKKLAFSARVRVGKGAGTIGLEEIFVGLAAVQTTTNFVASDGSALTVDDCIGFWADPSSGATIHCVKRDTDVQSIASAAATYADATWMVLAFDYDGTTLKFYKDDNLIASMITTLPAAALTPTLFIKAGEAAAKTLRTDYVFVGVEE